MLFVPKYHNFAKMSTSSVQIFATDKDIVAMENASAFHYLKEMTAVKAINEISNNLFN